jgi:hypothetical protein
VKAGVAYPGIIQTGSSPNLDLEEEGRTKRTSTRYRRTRQTVLRAGPLRAAKGYTRLFAFLISLREGGTFHRATSRARRMVWLLSSPFQACSLPLSPHSMDGIPSIQRGRPSRSLTARVEGNSSSDPSACYEKRLPTLFDDSISAVSNHT